MKKINLKCRFDASLKNQMQLCRTLLKIIEDISFVESFDSLDQKIIFTSCINEFLKWHPFFLQSVILVNINISKKFILENNNNGKFFFLKQVQIENLQIKFKELRTEIPRNLGFFFVNGTLHFHFSPKENKHRVIFTTKTLEKLLLEYETILFLVEKQSNEFYFQK